LKVQSQLRFTVRPCLKKKLWVDISSQMKITKHEAISHCVQESGEK
jgi:hypothetical protein